MSCSNLSTAGRCFVIIGLLSALLLTQGQEDDDWVDPFDMLNYDATTKTMKKPPDNDNDNVPTKRRESIQETCPLLQCPDVSECNKEVEMLQRAVGLQENKRKMSSLPLPPTCNPIFKRFIAKLLKEISKLGLSSEGPNGMDYDAKVHLSLRNMADLQKLLDGGESWTTGSVDDALSKILVDFKPHDHEAWKWRFEDTFGVELDTVLKTAICVLLIVLTICSEVWSKVSWFVQFKRMFSICFFISVVWNWFYLYKIAFAEHQNDIVKMESFNEKCTGVKKIDWMDNLSEWYRSTWTLQDDPCEKYYIDLTVSPFLLVSPIKAIIFTITTVLTEPLKYLGQGSNEFLRALLKDLPVTLQIPVFFTFMPSLLLSIAFFFWLCIYCGVPARLLRRGRRKPPPPRLQDQGQGQGPQLQQNRDSDAAEDEDNQHYLGAGDSEGEVDGEDQAAAAPAAKEVVKDGKRKEQPDKRVNANDSRKTEQGSEGDRTMTMKPSDQQTQQSTSSTQSQGPLTSDQVSLASLQGVSAEGASSEQKDTLLTSGHVEDIGVSVQEPGQ